jgi:hypothetical protein
LNRIERFACMFASKQLTAPRSARFQVARHAWNRPSLARLRQLRFGRATDDAELRAWLAPGGRDHHLTQLAAHGCASPRSPSPRGVEIRSRIKGRYLDGDGLFLR